MRKRRSKPRLVPQVPWLQPQEEAVAGVSEARSHRNLAKPVPLQLRASVSAALAAAARPLCELAVPSPKIGSGASSIA